MSDGARTDVAAVPGMSWVRGELESNLREAAQQVEIHAGKPQASEPLAAALQHLHLAHGVLVVVQACGAALLVGEARQALLDIAAGRIADIRTAAGVVIGACLQAIDVIDLVQQGFDDCALVLQPTINELRVARGKSLATEEDLFVAHFRMLPLELPLPGTWPAGDARSEAVRLSPTFSAALLSWFKDHDSARSLARIGRVAEIVSERCRRPPLWQLWRTLAACVEALLSGTLDPGLELKRQFGRAGQILKALAESGEDAAVQSMGDVSLRLLFHAGRSRGAGQRVAFLRTQLRLGLWLPSADQIQARRARLRGAGTDLLSTLVGEIRRDLADVRDRLDVALRSDADAPDFHAAGERLKRVADTLAMLGLADASAALSGPAEALQAVRRAGRVAAPEWKRCAAAILQVEQSVESALHRQLTGADGRPASREPALSDELRSGISALLREALANLLQVKEQVERGMADGRGSPTGDAERLLDEMAGGLSILGLAPAAELVQRLRRVLQSGELSGGVSHDAVAQEFADALAGVEYFIELRLGDSPAAQPVLDRMAQILAAPRWAQPDESRADRVGGFAPAVTVQIDIDGQTSGTPDDAIRQVFDGEAREIIAALVEASLHWRRNPNDRAALATIRRGFHTLKGSGRMVQAFDLAALALSMERLMDRCIDQAGPVSPAVIEQLEQSIAVLPAVLAAFVDGQAAPALAAELAGAADRLAGGKNEADAEALNPSISAPAEPPFPSPTGPDEAPTPELLAVFAPEACELLDALQEALDHWRDVPANAMPAITMQRDLHTFKGGARMAGLRSLGDAAHALETRLAALQKRESETSAGEVDGVGVLVSRLRQEVEDLLDRADAAPTTVAAAAERLAPPANQPASVGTQTGSLPDARGADNGWDPQLFWQPATDESSGSDARREAVRVPVETLDRLLSQAGEVAVQRARLEASQASLAATLADLARTLEHVRDQARHLEIENEAQIAARHFASGDTHRYGGQFDPLEMDRYSRLQELSRSLGEGLGDLVSLHGSLASASGESEALLHQQARLDGEVQQTLMGTLMVPFSHAAPRLHRLVQQTADQNGRQAHLELKGAENAVDRNLLERITAPLEHLLRNAIVHGIESPSERIAAGKSAAGCITLSLQREDAYLLIEVRDDGRGLDRALIHAHAVERGLVKAGAPLSEPELCRLVFTAGFSTARTLTQDAGRGIGLDVVAAEALQLGGSASAHSESGKGLCVRLRLPLALAVSQALIAQVGDELFALPLSRVEGVMRIAREDVDALQSGAKKTLSHAGKDYTAHWLADWVGLPRATRIGPRSEPAILVRLGNGADSTVAVLVDALVGNRAIVTRAMGSILESVPGVAGATLLSDGRVAIILDVPGLVARQQGAEGRDVPASMDATRRSILVADDSVTIRRVLERLLQREGYRPVLARDGLEAMALMQAEVPDAILLDIEMPRADGFEVAAFVRQSPRLARVPIVMITSRSGDKHREHAGRLAVDRYLTKPFQDDHLLQVLRELLGPAEGASA